MENQYTEFGNIPATEAIQILATWHHAKYVHEWTAADALKNPLLPMLADLALEASAIEFKNINQSVSPLDDLAWYQHEYETAAKLEMAITLLEWARIEFYHEHPSVSNTGGSYLLQAQDVVDSLTEDITQLSCKQMGGDIPGIANAARLKVRAAFLADLSTRMKIAEANNQEKKQA